MLHWREVFPGVPDSEIVLPRNSANGYSFPTPPYFTDDPSWWEGLIRLLSTMAMSATVSAAPGSDRDQQATVMRRVALRNIRIAMQWWRSLPKRSPLSVQQSLYSRKNYWKSSADFPEFLSCYVVALTWLNLPKSKQAPAAVQAKVAALLNDALDGANREIHPFWPFNKPHERGGKGV